MNVDDLKSCKCGCVVDLSKTRYCPVCMEDLSPFPERTREEKLQRKEFFRKRYYADMGWNYKPLQPTPREGEIKGGGKNDYGNR